MANGKDRRRNPKRRNSKQLLILGEKYNMLPIKLDQEEKPFEEEKVLTNEELLSMIEKDENLQQSFSKILDGMQSNNEINEEITAILHQLEGDNYDVNGGNRFINWETDSVPYRVLRRAAESEAGRLIINKRRMDLTQYARIAKDTEIKRGFRLVFQDASYTPTKYEREMLKHWEKRILRGFFFPPNSVHPSFAKFVGSAYEDFFTFDDMTWEIRTDGFDKPLGIHLTDPIIWKPVIKQRKYESYLDSADVDGVIQVALDDSDVMLYDNHFNRINEEEPDYLLIYNNKRIAAQNKDKLQKHHFYTRSDFRKTARGFSIVEQGLNIASYILNSLKYNASNFTNNRMPNGFIAFTGGSVGSLQLEKLKKLLYAHVNGTTSQKAFPMIGLKGDKGDAKWVGIGGNSKDMEFHIWITLVFSIWCQLSGTDPRELSLGAHADAVKGSSLTSESSDGITKESKDSGARAFLIHLAESLNTPNKYGENIFERLTGLKIECEFYGFEVEDRKAVAELVEKSLKSTRSINDLLAEEDEEDAVLMVGGQNVYDIKGIGSPTIYQAFMASVQQQMAQQQQQAGGMPAEAGESSGEELTEADRALIDKYKNDENVDVEEELINGE